MVTTKGAGMSVPDWPNSYGYNMFTFPPSQWIGGIFWEHTHRLMGSIVGFLWLTVAIWAWFVEPRRWVRRLAGAVLLAVIAQGVLGGLRVTENNLTLAIIHGCFAQLFLCLSVFFVITISTWWQRAPHPTNPSDTLAGRGLLTLSAVTAGVIFGQLVVGAWMRHTGAGLAIPDLPYAYGHFLPPTDQAGLTRANNLRVWTMSLHDRVTLQQIWLHFAHRIGAVVVSTFVIALFILAFKRFRSTTGLRWPIALLPVLLTLQFSLGVITVLKRKPADIATLHVVTGALLLLTVFVLTVFAAKLFGKAIRDQNRVRRRIAENAEVSFQT